MLSIVQITRKGDHKSMQHKRLSKSGYGMPSDDSSVSSASTASTASSSSLGSSLFNQSKSSVLSDLETSHRLDDSCVDKYGYGDAVPDIKQPYDAPAEVGYESASPDLSTSSDNKRSRRSSMKQSGKPRRASIQFGGEVQEYYLPGRSEPIRRRSSITFNEGVRVRAVTPVSSLTDKPEALWFQQKEYKLIKRRSIELVQKVNSGAGAGRKYCTRGLEHMMQPRRNSLEDCKYELWDTVLDEQERQREQGLFDEYTVSEAAQILTEAYQKEAQEQGQKDADEIAAYLKNTRRE